MTPLFLNSAYLTDLVQAPPNSKSKDLTLLEISRAARYISAYSSSLRHVGIAHRFLFRNYLLDGFLGFDDDFRLLVRVFSPDFLFCPRSTCRRRCLRTSHEPLLQSDHTFLADADKPLLRPVQIHDDARKSSACFEAD
jgi:hypothetical protein